MDAKIAVTAVRRGLVRKEGPNKGRSYWIVEFLLGEQISEESPQADFKGRPHMSGVFMDPEAVAHVEIDTDYRGEFRPDKDGKLSLSSIGDEWRKIPLTPSAAGSASATSGPAAPGK